VYLDVPSSDVTTTDVQLMFNFATGTATPSSRSWNIKIALLPCGADYLGNRIMIFLFYKRFNVNGNLFSYWSSAPVDCLQYFTAPTGRVSSFNWRDVPVSAIRQLNNQNYNICFRTELVDRQVYYFSFSCISISNNLTYFVLNCSVINSRVRKQPKSVYQFARRPTPAPPIQ
jgi:hypothetical protein